MSAREECSIDSIVDRKHLLMLSSVSVIRILGTARAFVITNWSGSEQELRLCGLWVRKSFINNIMKSQNTQGPIANEKEIYLELTIPSSSRLNYKSADISECIFDSSINSIEATFWRCIIHQSLWTYRKLNSQTLWVYLFISFNFIQISLDSYLI